MLAGLRYRRDFHSELDCDGAQGMQPQDLPPALETSESPSVIEEFPQASRLALEAGFDGVELHAASGYLPAQFLSTGTNQRTDEYGGSLTNRIRFTVGTLNAAGVGVPARHALHSTGHHWHAAPTVSRSSAGRRWLRFFVWQTNACGRRGGLHGLRTALRGEPRPAGAVRARASLGKGRSLHVLHAKSRGLRGLSRSHVKLQIGVCLEGRRKTVGESPLFYCCQACRILTGKNPGNNPS